MQKSRFLLASALASSSLFLLAQPAWSQDAAPQAADDGAKAEEIIVTGSRIASPDLVSASPLQIVSDAAIKSRLAEVKIQSADIRPIAPSLEDVFVTLTAEQQEDKR